MAVLANKQGRQIWHMLMKQNNQFDNDRIKIQESIESDYEKLTLANDFMFGKVMQDERNCIGMLERLTGNEIGSVKTVVEQKVISVLMIRIYR